MKKTVFSTPVVSPLCRGLARLLLRGIGWRVVGTPPERRQFVLIGAPHTSNWDFPLMLLAVFAARLDVHWMGKAALFPRGLGWWMRWLGGMPIDRSKANNTVEQMVAAYSRFDDLILLIPPEGTRSRVERWKTGFYHIAHQAKVPIVLGFVDGENRRLGFGPVFEPSGDVEADMHHIRSFYAGFSGLRRELS